MEDCNERPFLFWSGSHFVRIFALFLVPERKQEGIGGTVLRSDILQAWGRVWTCRAFSSEDLS